jgi:hypothetical protein
MLSFVGPLASGGVSITGTDCRNLATGATQALATSPIPDAKLESDWHAFLIALKSATRPCATNVSGHPNIVEMREAIRRLTVLAVELPAEVHRLPAS